MKKSSSGPPPYKSRFFDGSQETRFLSQPTVLTLQMLRPCLQRFLADALHTASEQAQIITNPLSSSWFLSHLLI